ncbi:MAG: hypothetical protein ACKVQC_00345 [Elusimicrobiota bacterium]
MNKFLSSKEVVENLKSSSFKYHEVIIVGFGYMGKEYVKAAQSLGFGQITVYTRTKPKESPKGIKIVSGGFEKLPVSTNNKNLVIVAVSTDLLLLASEWIIKQGYKNILCEKPVSLWSTQIEELNKMVLHEKVSFYCAFNRIAFPSVIEARYQCDLLGGVTSCRYSFTELAKRLNLSLYSESEKKRWGIANSIHVLSLAHAVIGNPRTWNSVHGGALDWHPSGSYFIGSGISVDNIPFSFFSDWGSSDRWSVEFFTSGAAFRLCPLEKLYLKESSLVDWKECAVSVCDSNTKPGLLEQMAAILFPEKCPIPLFQLDKLAQLVQFSENIFGYSEGL